MLSYLVSKRHITREEFGVKRQSGRERPAWLGPGGGRSIPRREQKQDNQQSSGSGGADAAAASSVLMPLSSYWGAFCADRYVLS